MSDDKYLCLVCGKWNAPLDRLYCDEHKCAECDAETTLFLVDEAGQEYAVCEPCIMSAPSGKFHLIAVDELDLTGDLIRCPYCGYSDPDTSLVAIGANGGEIECGCGRPMWVEIDTSITYTTRKIESPTGTNGLSGNRPE